MNEIRVKSIIPVKTEPVHYYFIEMKAVNADFNNLIASILDFTEYGFNLKLSENKLAVCIIEEEEMYLSRFITSSFSTISKSFLRIKTRFRTCILVLMTWIFWKWMIITEPIWKKESLRT